MSKTKIVYKVVDKINKRLCSVSVIARKGKEYSGIFYSTKKLNRAKAKSQRPRDALPYLFVFNSLHNAQAFKHIAGISILSERSSGLSIYAAKAYGLRPARSSQWPNGTKFCTSLRLIKKVG